MMQLVEIGVLLVIVAVIWAASIALSFRMGGEIDRKDVSIRLLQSKGPRRFEVIVDGTVRTVSCALDLPDSERRRLLTELERGGFIVSSPLLDGMITHMDRHSTMIPGPSHPEGEDEMVQKQAAFDLFEMLPKSAPSIDFSDPIYRFDRFEDERDTVEDLTTELDELATDDTVVVPAPSPSKTELPPYRRASTDSGPRIRKRPATTPTTGLAPESEPKKNTK